MKILTYREKINNARNLNLFIFRQTENIKEGVKKKQILFNILKRLHLLQSKARIMLKNINTYFDPTIV